jgi:tripartite-type tricarboxylate transporter receptor subunit TctC
MQGSLGRRLLLGALVARAVAAQAELRPDRPVRMMMPSGPGSGADIIARTVSVAAVKS